MKKRIIYFLLIYMMCYGISVQASERLSISLDVAQFAGADNQTYLELYYSLPEKEITYRRNLQNLFESNILLTLQIKQSDTLWATKTWRVSNTVKDTSKSALKEQLIDLIRYPISAGKSYQIQLFARDLHSGRLDSAAVACTGHDFNLPGLQISDIQLANNIQPFDSLCSRSFQKRIYCVTPNPELTFSGSEGALYYYFEVYHIADNIQSGPYYISCIILDGNGDVCQQIPPNKQYKKVRQNMSREIGQFSINNLASGLYELVCTVSDSLEHMKITKSKRFLVRNPTVKMIAQNIVTRSVSDYKFLEGMTKEMLDAEFDKMEPILTKKQRDFYKKIKEFEGRKNYLYQLWAECRNPEFPTVEDFRNDYMNRLRYVEGTYKSGLKPGWKSDRGRIYLKYGKPSDIERHPSSIDTVPYEIWHYEGLEGGVIFVFIDRLGINSYELIHSTKRGEMNDPNWQRQLAPVVDSNFRM